MRTCEFPGCDRTWQGRGYCISHLRQFNAGKELKPLRVYSNSRQTCSFEGCDEGHQAKGLCRGHYRQRHHFGRDLTPLRKRTPNNRRCEYEGCDRPHNAKGLCATHGAMLRSTGTLGPVRARKGRWVNGQGYVTVVAKGHSEANCKGYALEHRMVMSEMLGRPLLPGENVHHINGVKTDNRPENLELWVSMQPSGQRTEDLLEWAYEILARYGGADADAQRLVRSRTIPLFRRSQAA